MCLPPPSLPGQPGPLQDREAGLESLYRETGFSCVELAEWAGLPVSKIHSLLDGGELRFRRGLTKRRRISWASAQSLLGETRWWPHTPEEAPFRFSIRVKEAAQLLGIPHTTLASKLHTHEFVPMRRLGHFVLLRPVDMPLVRKWMRKKTPPFPRPLAPGAEALNSAVAARQLGVAQSLIYYWVKQGMLAARRSGLGSRIYISKAAVLRLQQAFNEHRSKHPAAVDQGQTSYSNLARAAFGLPPSRRGRPIHPA
jgi:hypothetical protein